jgi:hypothetical protein
MSADMQTIKQYVAWKERNLGRPKRKITSRPVSKKELAARDAYYGYLAEHGQR